MIKKLEIGIIGSGIFGLSIACKLSSIAKNIDVYEKEAKILNGATRYNHNRHHAGYHYPRSSATVDQCRLSNESFFNIYKDALDFKFRNFYVISKHDSRITPKRFETFCKLHGLSINEISPPKEIFNLDNIDKGYLVKEGIYNFYKLKDILLKRVNSNKNITIKKNSHVASKIDKQKFLNVYDKNLKENYTKKYDIIINASYSSINDFIEEERNKIFLEYNLQEMIKLSFPSNKLKFPLERFGATVLDGNFPSILPNAEKKAEYLFAHVKYSQLIKKKGKICPVSLSKKIKINSEHLKIFQKSSKYLKILNQAKYKDSFFVVRAVKINKKTDERTSEVIKYNNGNYSIFSSKIVTVENVAKATLDDIKISYSI
jgi:hypothetical protein